MKQERHELPKLHSLSHKDIIIKPADKGSAIVILEKLLYISEGQMQLNNTQFYEKKTSSDLTGEVIHRVNLHVYDMLQKGQISPNTCNYLTTDIDRTQFYLLPRIHKDPNNPPGRPIVSGSGGPTEKISQFVDHFIGPLASLSQSFIRDSTHIINILDALILQPWMLLCTLDITSLYTNIPHNEGIQSNKRYSLFTEHPKIYLTTAT